MCSHLCTFQKKYIGTCIIDDDFEFIQHLSGDSNGFEGLHNKNPMGSTAEIPSSSDQYAKLVEGISSSDLDNAFDSIKSVRKLLSDKNPPTDDFIALNAVPRLVELLRNDELPELQFEAAWALVNIAAGSSDQTECVVSADSLPHFLRLLESPVEKVAEQAAWALANIAGDGPRNREKLIQMGIIHSITRLVESNVSGSLFENVSWCLSNLCRHRDPPMSLATARECLPTIRLLLFHDNPEVISNACWALTYITEVSNYRIQEVVNLDVVERLIAILQSSNDRNIAIPPMRALGNIVSGTEEQTQVVIDHGGLSAFKYVLQHPSLNLHNKVAWILSNMVTGSIAQIQAVIEHGFLNHLIAFLDSPAEKTRREATWAICNLAKHGSLEQIVELVRCGGFPPLIRMSFSPDSQIKQIVLKACNQILNAGIEIEDEELSRKIIEESETLFHHLEQLKEDKDKEISALATRLIQEYSESHDDDYILPPSEQGFKLNLRMDLEN